MKILFLITITDSFGEREHAVSFARQLQNTEFQPVFFLNPQLRTFFGDFSFECYYSNSLNDLKDVIRNEKPGLIICCEYYHLFQDFRNYLLALEIPLATMDGTTIGEEINSDPLKLGTGKSNKLPEQVIKLRPCPVNDPRENTKNIKYWNLFPDIKKEEYSHGNFDKNLFMAVSPWAVKACMVMDLNHYYNYLFERLTKVLIKMPYKINFTVVSPFKPQLIRNNNLSINFIEYIDYRTYEKLLLNADLVISDNIIQTSLSKAFMAGINTLALLNSSDENYMNIYKFNIFPLKILFPEEREYFRAIEKAELFTKNEPEDKIIKLLSTDINDNTYKNKVKLLQKPEQILTSIIHNS